MGDEAQPLRPKAKAQSRAVRASRIPSAFAKDVDKADQREASGDDGFGLRRINLHAEGCGDHNEAAPCAVFFEAVEDVTHALAGVSKPARLGLQPRHRLR